MKILIENTGGHGAIHQPVRRWFNRKWRRHISKRYVARGVGIDYTVGSPFRSVIQNVMIKNQGTNDSCGGQAGSYFLEVQDLIRGVKEGELSAKSVYAPIAYLGGGTTIQDLERQIETGGANLESAVPSYDAYGNPLIEPLMQSRSWETPALIADAKARAGYVSVDIDLNDIDAVAEAIATYGAVIWEIEGQNGNTPDWRSPTPQPPSQNTPQPVFHHFMCAYDFTMYNGQKAIMAFQSEGTSWGQNGIQFFGENYFTNGFIDPFTFEYDANIQVPVQQPQSLWSQLLWFFSGWAAVDKLFQS